jgi:hypothetical protein
MFNLPPHHAIPDLADSVLGVLFMVCGIMLVHVDDKAASGGVAHPALIIESLRPIDILEKVNGCSR